MNETMYRFYPIRVKRNIRLIGRRKGKVYWRFGMGARWENGWMGKQGTPGAKKLMGWSFFVGPYRLIFGGKTNVLAELHALKGR